MFGDLLDKTYLVGGFVRDELMGGSPADVDYVVEATENDFLMYFPNAPKVGQSFPVFLVDGCEVALTRTEQSTGPGYSGFVCHVGVSLAEDLGRRDFTINSVARNVVTDELVDPYGGVRDIEQGVVRCVNSQAFVEDPVRILRAARFAARFGFQVDASTRKLIREHVAGLKDVTRERVAAELEKAYTQSVRPSQFFRELDDLGGLKLLFAPLEALKYVPAGPRDSRHGFVSAFEHTMESVDRAKANGCSFSVFLAVLCHDFGKGTTPAELLPHHYRHEKRSVEIASAWLQGNRFRKYDAELALAFAREHMKVHCFEQMKPSTLVSFFRALPAKYRTDFIAASNCDAPLSESQQRIFVRLQQVLAMKVDASRLSKVKAPKAIPAEVHRQYVEMYRGLEKL